MTEKDPEKELANARQEAAHIAYALRKAEQQRNELRAAIEAIVGTWERGNLASTINHARYLVEEQKKQDRELDINATVGSVAADFARWRTGDFT
jgi:hypothetical protein